MKNNLADLNDSLFEMLEKLSDSETLEDEKKLGMMLRQANAACSISSQILKVAKLQVQALRVAEDCGLLNEEMPALLAVKDSKKKVIEGVEQKQKLLGVSK